MKNVDLRTEYLGLKLHSPLVPSASPLSEEIDDIKRMEDSGAAAVVLYSLFQEQLVMERFELHHHLSHGSESHAEAISYFPEPDSYHLGSEDYLEHVRRAKEAVNIPIIASLNGSSLGGWTEYARHMQDAGADAIELNIYTIPATTELTSADVEKGYIEILEAVRREVSIPLSVKLSPYFSSLAHMAQQLDQEGADGLVLFNRFYQPDIDLDTLDVVPGVLLSTPQAMRLPLRWIAMIYGRIEADLAATGGIHTGQDALKMLMAGAKVTMLCSSLLKRGIGHIRTIEQQMRNWMEEFEYESVKQMQGSMSQVHCADPASYERAQYMRALHSYRPADQSEG